MTTTQTGTTVPQDADDGIGGLPVRIWRLMIVTILFVVVYMVNGDDESSLSTWGPVVALGASLFALYALGQFNILESFKKNFKIWVVLLTIYFVGMVPYGYIRWMSVDSKWSQAYDRKCEDFLNKNSGAKRVENTCVDATYSAEWKKAYESDWKVKKKSYASENKIRIAGFMTHWPLDIISFAGDFVKLMSGKLTDYVVVWFDNSISKANKRGQS